MKPPLEQMGKAELYPRVTDSNWNTRRVPQVSLLRPGILLVKAHCVVRRSSPIPGWKQSNESQLKPEGNREAKNPTSLTEKEA